MPTGTPRVLQKVYDYQPGATWLDWDLAPDPPEDDDWIWEPALEWDSPHWDKSYAGYLVTARVREEIYDSFRVFPNFPAPILLDQAGFRKFCYLASDDYVPDGLHGDKLDETRDPLCLTEWPSNYLPMNYSNPLRWTRRRFEEREARKSWQHLKDAWEDEGDDESDDSDYKYTSPTDEEDELFIDTFGYLVKSNDRVRLINYESEEHLNGTIGIAWYLDPQADREGFVTVFMHSISEDTAISISIYNLCKFVLSGSAEEANRWKFPSLDSISSASVSGWFGLVRPKAHPSSDDKEPLTLLDLSADLKGQIASWLDIATIHHSLRRTCKEAFWNFRPPPPVVEYDFIHFGIQIQNRVWHGVAYTVEDLVPALQDFWHELQPQSSSIYGAPCRLSLQFLQVPNWSQHTLLPLGCYVTVRDPQDETPLLTIDDLGHRQAGVRIVRCQVELHHRRLFLEAMTPKEGTAEALLQAPHEVSLQTLKRARCLKPRHSSAEWIPLDSIGTRLVDCTCCGHGREECTCSHEHDEGPGGNSGVEARIYYCPMWFGGDQEKEQEPEAKKRVRFFESTIEIEDEDEFGSGDEDDGRYLIGDSSDSDY